MSLKGHCQILSAEASEGISRLADQRCHMRRLNGMVGPNSHTLADDAETLMWAIEEVSLGTFHRHRKEGAIIHRSLASQNLLLVLPIYSWTSFNATAAGYPSAIQ